MSSKSRGGEIFTTGEVALMFSVAPKTVSKWFDSGQLKGYRMPGGVGPGDRRITREALLRFCEKFGVPVPVELQPPRGEPKAA